MRILYHHRTLAEDAQGIHIEEMVKAFRHLGHEVLVVSVERSGGGTGARRLDLWRRLRQWSGHRFYELMTVGYNAYGFLHLARAIRRWQPEVIYERYALNNFCGVLASRHFGVPLLLEVNAPLSYENRRLGTLAFHRLARATERWICSNSTRTIVVSEAMKQLLGRAGVTREKMVVMPNGVDLEAFHPGVSGAAVRQRYGLTDRVVAGFVGWFREWHGLDTLLEVAHQARLGDAGVRLLLVGDGPAFPRLRELVERRGLASVVVFTGAVSRQEVPAHIAAMDVAVQPNVTEYASPMKIFEYMAVGKCIVAPNRPNIREILTDGVTGCLFDPEDHAEFGHLLRRVLGNHRLREAVGGRAWQAVQERGYLWAHNARRALDLVTATRVDPRADLGVPA